MVEFASKTRTLSPARASVIADARPFGPEPTMAASYSPTITRRSRGLRSLFPTQSRAVDQNTRTRALLRRWRAKTVLNLQFSPKPFYQRPPPIGRGGPRKIRL